MSIQSSKIMWDVSELGWPTLDKQLFNLVLTIMLLGWVMITSASMDYAQYLVQNPYHFAIKHAVAMLIAMMAAAVVLVVPLHWWYRLSGLALLIAILLLVAVLIPGLGHKVNGSYRWLNFGFYNLQPSELAKVAVVLYLSGYLVRRQQEVQSSWWGFIKPMLVLGPVSLLIVLEPDLGTTVVVLFASLGLLFVGGVKLFQYLSILVSAVGLLGFALFSQEYRIRRLAAYLDPFAEENRFDGGYQLTQSLIAIGRGEYFGLGLGNSIQKLFYLPEAHTDFIFAIVAEEFGLIGCLILIALFGWLVFRVLYIGNRAAAQGLRFGAYITYGVALIFICQIFVNMSVTMGLLPTKGLTLPLFSYGGSSLLASCIMMALVFRVASETQAQERAND